MNLSTKSKNKIYNILTSFDDPFNESKDTWIFNFLESIWDINSMPSFDDRFDNARNDIYQHMVNNNDWDIDFLFIDRLDLFGDISIFSAFVSQVLKNVTNEDEQLSQNTAFEISSILEKEGLQLFISDYKDDYPVYNFGEFDPESTPVTFKESKYKFFVHVAPMNSRNYRSLTSHEIPNESPCFVLVLDNTWNDYSLRSTFALFFYDSKGTITYISDLKIIDNAGSKSLNLPEEFIKIPDKFCSLGQDMQYYEKLSDLLGNEFLGVLYALRDIAFFSSIQEQYESLHYYKYSLIRYDEAEKTLREAKHIIHGNDLNSLYSFKYRFTPKYSDVELLVDLDFKDSDHLPDRVIAIIGENGTGKTQLVSSLPKDLGAGNSNLFEPHLPLFSKVIAVSYSVFDTFNIPSKTATFNYVYCGIRKKEGDMMTSVGLKNRFHRSCKEIFATDRTIKWRKVLITLLGVDMVNSFLMVNEKSNEWYISLKDFGIVSNQLSSGQSILLYIFTEIVANIRYDSLLLFDEPETHLHPNAITVLMNTIYSLVSQFQAYCILATHSPIVIRECFSRNVFILERKDDFPMFRRIEIESFGQNLSVLTDEVFGNKEIHKHYKSVIDKMVANSMSYDEIIEELRDGELPLSINIKVYIKSVTS